eukprot:COSAG05_NODE_2324_length_3235_cov_2.008610_3_plen_51_part_00
MPETACVPPALASPDIAGKGSPSLIIVVVDCRAGPVVDFGVDSDFTEMIK